MNNTLNNYKAKDFSEMGLVPVWEKYSLTVVEAAEYFNIGQNRLWDMIHENEEADFLLYKGRGVLIKREKFERYLDDIELVVVGGESDRLARPLDYAWVLDIREQCIRKNVSFEFRQCGTNFIKDGKQYRIQTKDLCSQARKADIDFKRAL